MNLTSFVDHCVNGLSLQKFYDSKSSRVISIEAEGNYHFATNAENMRELESLLRKLNPAKPYSADQLILITDTATALFGTSADVRSAVVKALVQTLELTSAETTAIQTGIVSTINPFSLLSGSARSLSTASSATDSVHAADERAVINNTP